MNTQKNFAMNTSATYFTFNHINKTILEKETFAFIEKMLGVAVDEAMKDIFKDWK